MNLKSSRGEYEVITIYLVTFNAFRRAAIHAEAPEFVEMSTEQEILVTGIKVVDLLAPYAKGGKIGVFCSDELLILLLY